MLSMVLFNPKTFSPGPRGQSRGVLGILGEGAGTTGGEVVPESLRGVGGLPSGSASRVDSEDYP